MQMIEVARPAIVNQVMQNSGPLVEKTKQNPHPGHNLPSSNAKISMKKEHNSTKAVLSKFSIIFHLTIFFNHENKVFASLYTALKSKTV